MSGRAAHLSGIDLPMLWGAIETVASQAEIGVFVLRLQPGPPLVTYVSPRAAAIIGRTTEDVIGTAPWDLLRGADREQVAKLAVRTDGTPSLSMSFVIDRPDGTHVPVEVATTRLETGAATFVLGYFRDVTLKQSTLEALRESEARFRFLVEAAPDGVVILVHGTIVFINPRAAQLLGAGTPDAALGRPISAFLPPEDVRLTSQRIAEMFRSGGEMPPNEYGTLVDPNRTVEIKSVRCEWEGAPAVLAFARDVTERKVIQRRLVESDRLASLGTLAAGVAHEINNPLTYAQLSVQRIERELGGLNLPDATLASLRGHLHAIDHGIMRVGSITQSLRTFARADDSPPGPVDLVAVVDQAIKLVDNDLRHRARLVRRISDVPAASGNGSRLEQVIVNLLLNAMHALTGDDPERRQIEIAVEARGAEHVALLVRDTGRGIPPEVRARVFEPFFTTRPIGEGMGLGLAVSRSIVEGFGGDISIDSTPGVGTTVTVVLLVHRGPAPRIPAPQSVVSTRRRQRVLLVDDERLVRDVLVRLLSHTHEVTAVDSGADALTAIERTPFDVVVCDVMMPGMSGCEVHRRAAGLHPGIEGRFVFMTGGTFAPELESYLQTAGNRCIPKPFKLEQVLTAIADVAT